MTDIEESTGKFVEIRKARTIGIADATSGSMTAIWLNANNSSGVLNRLICVLAISPFLWFECCGSWLENQYIPDRAKLREVVLVPWRLFRFIVLGKSSGVLRYEFGK